MAERVLTDGEIDALWGEGYSVWNSPLLSLRKKARAVEAAVLRKVGTPLKCLGEHHVTEREARKRERAAFESGVLYIWPVGDFPKVRHGWRDERDRCYPLPKCDKCGHELP